MRDLERLQARVQELEIQCAALWDALGTISDLVSRLPNYLLNNPEVTHELEKAAKALSSNAGRDLLERLKKLETVAKVAKAVINEWSDPVDGMFNSDVLWELKKVLEVLEDGE